MSQITYRIAAVEDIPTISRFRITQLRRGGAVVVEGLEEPNGEFFAHCFQNGTIHQIFACDGEKEIATGAVLFFWYPPSHMNPSGKIAYISNMFTLPEYRNRGIATQILHMLEDEARRRGVQEVKLGATELGAGLYRRNGYKDDVLCHMQKRLEL